jgi:cytoskeletal protein RodZ
MAEEKQDGQKTLVAFVVGLLIGGMLVWAFSGPSAQAPLETGNDDTQETTDNEQGTDTAEETSNENSTDTEQATTPAPELQVGTGEIVVPDQAASAAIELESATYPVSEGWIGVRQFNNDQLGYILGVVRFSESQGLIPSEIVLQQPTTAGNEYAVVVFTEDGDFDFNLAGDVQIDTIFDTFTAQ